MIPTVIELTVLLSKSPDKVTIVTSDDGVISMVEEHGRTLAKQTGVKHLVVQKFDPDGVKRMFNVDYEAIEEVFGEKAPVIVGKIATLSYESIKKNISKGILKLSIEGKEYEVQEESLEEDFKAPEGHELKPFSKGYVYFKTDN